MAQRSYKRRWRTAVGQLRTRIDIYGNTFLLLFCLMCARSFNCGCSSLGMYLQAQLTSFPHKILEQAKHFGTSRSGKNSHARDRI